LGIINNHDFEECKKLKKIINLKIPVNFLYFYKVVLKHQKDITDSMDFYPKQSNPIPAKMSMITGLLFLNIQKRDFSNEEPLFFYSVS